MMDLSVSDGNLTDQKGVGFDSLLISAQNITEKSHIEKTMGNSDITTDTEITSDFNCLDDVGILQSPPEVGLFSNTGVMDCLPDLQPSTEFPTLESVDTDEVTALPFHGPLCDPEANLETDVLDSNATAGVCGLRNLGNTCFMNSGLQCLFNNKQFIQFFLENNVEAHIKDVLTNKFAEVLRKVWSGQFSVLHLSEFKEAIGSSYPQFRDYRQHDCQEFLALLLDTMHEQINVAFQSGVKLDSTDLCETVLPAINKGSVQNLPSFSRTDSTVCGQLSSSVESAKDSEAEMCTKDNSVLSQNLSPRRTNIGLHLETAKKCDRNFVGELNEQFQTAVKNPDLPGMSSKAFSEITDDPSIYEKNTEKMADLLINNRQFDRHLSKNELEENIVTSEVLLKQKLYNVQKRQCFPLTSSSCDTKLEKNELASKLNVGRKIPNIDDFVKDTKILNTNVLISEEPNNLFKFDSEKFPKHENNRLRETVDNLGEILEFDTKQSSLKRVKVTNIIQEQKDLTGFNPDDSKSKMCISKRIKIEDMESPQTFSYSPTLEQDSIMDTEQTNEADSEESSQSGETNPVGSEQRWILLPDEELKANTVWENYKAANKSVIVDTFHGQFRSTVVCSECSHVSITYEPFMYLPVPLPHALERQIVITYIPNKGRHPIRYLVNVKKHERVKKIKEALLELIEDCPNEIMLAEVFENHISKILDDNTLVRQVNDISRTVYAFEIAQYSKQEDNESRPSNDCSEDTAKSSSEVLPSAQTSQTWDDATPTQTVENPTLTKCGSALAPSLSPNSSNAIALGCSSGTSGVACGDYSKSLQHPESELCDIGNLFGDNEIPESSRPSSLQTSENFGTVQWHSCAICLEDLADYNLMVHPNCQCILCKSCIEVSCKHYGGDSFICPVCSTSVSPSEDFVPVTKLEDFKYKISMIPVPVVVRHDFLEDQNLHFKTLVGHPGLLKLPTCLPAVELYEYVDKTVPFISPYSLLLVDGQGKNCSRCLFNQHCSGCEIARVGDIRLQPGDSLAVRYLDVGKETLESIARVTDHKSMQQKRHKNTLNLYDCLEAFSERENLDENSTWFCPECCQNQRAIKSLSVWRFPEVLIVCLKRFVFHDYTSIKLDEKVAFPLEGLDLSSYSSGPISDDLIYDLQACVCHFGNLSSGHYTSYTKHAVTNEWYYYNDETVCKRVPKTEDSMNEYILFYQKR